MPQAGGQARSPCPVYIANTLHFYTSYVMCVEDRGIAYARKI